MAFLQLKQTWNADDRNHSSSFVPVTRFRVRACTSRDRLAGKKDWSWNIYVLFVKTEDWSHAGHVRRALDIPSLGTRLPARAWFAQFCIQDWINKRYFRLPLLPGGLSVSPVLICSPLTEARFHRDFIHNYVIHLRLLNYSLLYL